MVNTFSDCEGCELDNKNCKIREYIREIQKTKPRYKKCPCMECLVKVPCKSDCEKLTQYHETIRSVIEYTGWELPFNWATGKKENG